MNVTEVDKKTVDGDPLPYRPVYVEVPLEDIKGRIIRNPGYGGPSSGINGWPYMDCVSQARKPLFMEALRDSIREEGFRNPIVAYASNSGVYVSFGGSRVLAGRDLGVGTIPCIVNDYAQRFAEAPTVTEGNFTSWFKDPPAFYEITEVGADYHYSIERNRRHAYDEAGMAWAGDADFISKEFPWLAHD